MKIIVQRVKEACVSVDSEIVGSITNGRVVNADEEDAGASGHWYSCDVAKT